MKPLLFAIFLITTCHLDAQHTNVLLGGNQDEKGESLIECSNGDIILAGHTDSYGAGQTDIFISRLTSNGQIIWSKSYGFSGDEDSQNLGLFETANGDILCSFFTDALNQTRVGVIIRLDANGAIIWQKKIGAVGGDSEWTRGIIEHDDGSIYVGNTVNNQLFGSSDGMITKLAPNGNLIWSKSIGVALNDHIWSLVPLPNNEILLNMNSQSLGPGTRAAVIVKIDSDGNILEEMAIGGSLIDMATNVKYDPSFGYLIAGGTTSFGQGDYDAFVARLDSNFNVLWYKTYGGTLYDYGASVKILNSDSCLLYMNSTNPVTSDKQLCLINIDGDGNTIFSKAIGDQFIQTVNHNAGQSLLYSSQQNKLFLTGLYGNSFNSSDALFLSSNGIGNQLCNDTIISSSFHSPVVQSVSFNIGDLGYVSDINIISNVILNLNQEYLCDCPMEILEIQDTSICEGVNLNYDLDTNFSYSWSPSNSFSCGSCPDPTFTGNSNTSVTVVIDNGTCLDTADFLISLTPNDPLDIIAPDSVCGSDQPFTIDANNLQGTWTGDGLTSQNDGVFNPSIADSGMNTIIFSPENSCFETDTVEIFVEESVVAEIFLEDSLVCIDGPQFLVEGSPSDAEWSGFIQDSIGNDIYFDPETNGIGSHTIYLSPQESCSQDDSVRITVNTLDVNVTDSIVVCNNIKSINVEVSPNGGNWVGVDNETVFNNNTINPSVLNPGVYEYVYHVNNGCIDSDTLILQILEVPEISLIEDTTLCYGCELEIEVENVGQNDSVIWSNGSNEASIEILSGGLYSVTVFNDLGCFDEASINIEEVCNSSLYIPNSFTPDGSGINDIFEAYHENITIHSIEIYNRWGTRIYDRKSEPFSWDGMYKGQIIQEGVYVYKIEYSECDHVKSDLKVGHLNVLK